MDVGKKLDDLKDLYPFLFSRPSAGVLEEKGVTCFLNCTLPPNSYKRLANA